MTLPKEITEAMGSYLSMPNTRTAAALESAILAYGRAEREGALREAAKEVERMAAHTSREDEEQFVVIGAYGAAARAIRALTSRPEPADENLPTGGRRHADGAGKAGPPSSSPEPAPESEEDPDPCRCPCHVCDVPPASDSCGECCRPAPRTEEDR